MKELKGLKGIAAWNVYNKVSFNLIFLRRFNFELIDHGELLKELATMDDLEALQMRLPELQATGQRTHKTAKHCIMALKDAEPIDQRLMLLEALSFADLDDDEVYRLLAVHHDANGIPYSRANIQSFPIVDSTELMIQTLIACCAVHVDLGLVTEQEIADLAGYRIDVKAETADVLGSNTDLTVGELLSLVIKKAFKKA